MYIQNFSKTVFLISQLFQECHERGKAVSERFPHPAGGRRLEAFLCFVQVVLLLKVQVALELD